jgi:hypothetical protein
MLKLKKKCTNDGIVRVLTDYFITGFYISAIITRHSAALRETFSNTHEVIFVASAQ